MKTDIKPFLKKEALLSTVSQAGGAVVGLGLSALVNKQSNTAGKVWVPLGAFALGLFGIHYFNVTKPKDWLQKMVQGAAVGGGIYGGLKSVEYLLAPSTSGGLRGFIPENIKTKILQFIPTFKGLGDPYSGYSSDPLAAIMGVNTYTSYGQNAAISTYPIEAASFSGMSEGEFQVAEVL